MNHLFIVGAQRSGSTYLYRLLDSHPQVMMARPAHPEPKFFLNDQLFRNGCGFYEARYFKTGSSQTRYFGEKSTSYIESIEVARRIQTFYPDAHILMILRDPVQRAWSNYRFSVQHGLETLGFEAALAAESQRLANAKFVTSVNPYAYRHRGYYLDYIKDYLQVFTTHQLHIVIFEEFVANLHAVQSLYRSLEIDATFIPPSLGEVVNPGNQGHEVPLAAFWELALDYRQSIQELEKHLNRPLDIWRRQQECF